MQRVVLAFGLLGALSGLAGVARADRVVLVGGTALEGKATRKGGKVVVEMESGNVTLPADSVQRIEKASSVVSRFEDRYAALRPGDARARLELADYCRDHEMRGRERQLLGEVIEIEPNNAVARARLGYVKTEAGWVTQGEANRAKGLVERDGRWVSPGEARAMDREESELREAARRREEADEQLAQRKADLATQEAALRAEQEAERSRSYFRTWAPNPVYFTPLYGSPLYHPRFGQGYRGYDDCAYGGDCRRGYRPPARPSPAPFDTSMSVVKVPYRHP